MPALPDCCRAKRRALRQRQNPRSRLALEGRTTRAFHPLEQGAGRSFLCLLRLVEVALEPLVDRLQPAEQRVDRLRGLPGRSPPSLAEKRPATEGPVFVDGASTSAGIEQGTTAIGSGRGQCPAVAAHPLLENSPFARPQPGLPPGLGQLAAVSRSRAGMRRVRLVCQTVDSPCLLQCRALGVSPSRHLPRLFFSGGPLLRRRRRGRAVERFVGFHRTRS